MSRTLFLSVPLFCLAMGPAFAADPSPERAAVAEDAIRDFMRDLLGPSVRVGDKPVRLQPNGDGYDASANFGPGEQVTARVKEGAAGVWTFEKLRYPNPVNFTVDVPSVVPNAPANHLTYDIKAADQDGAGAIDTTMATPSTSSGELRALDVTLTGADQSSTSHIGSGTANSTLRPGTAPGTVDLLGTSSLKDYSVVVAAQTPATPETPSVTVNLRLDMDGVDASTHVSGIAPGKGMALMRQTITLLATSMGRRDAAGSAPFDPKPVHDMVALLDGVATSAGMDETATKLQGVVNGFAFSVERARVGMDGQSLDGQLAMGMEFEADGLTLPALAGTPMAPLIPSKFEIHPSVSGVSTHDLLAALSAATDPARPSDAGPPPEFMALLTSPNLGAALDSFEVDLGPSVLKGTGKVTMPAPGQVAGTGRITVTEFDALTDRVKTLPEANQALPAMLFAKGIGRTEGNQLVWDISYQGSKLLVNGVDILAMAGGGSDQGPSQPAPARPARPAPGRPSPTRPNR